MSSVYGMYKMAMNKLERILKHLYETKGAINRMREAGKVLSFKHPQQLMDYAAEHIGLPFYKGMPYNELSARETLNIVQDYARGSILENPLNRIFPPLPPVK